MRRISLLALFRIVAMLAVSAPLAYAGETWPTLPTDAEIEQAKANLFQGMTADHPSIGEIGAGASGIELTKLTMDRYRLGDELLKSEVTDGVVTKMHRPNIQDPVKSSEVMLAFTYRGLWERPSADTYKKLEYKLYMLEYNADPIYQPVKLWYFTPGGFGSVAVQADSGSMAQRDAVLQSYFLPGRFAPGFPGDYPSQPPVGEPIPWIPVAAGAAALAAAIAVVLGATLRHKRTPPPSEKSRPAAYLLQLSADSVQLAVGQSVAVQATVWRVDPGRPGTIASEAGLQIVVPAPATWLQVTPLQGSGRINFQVSLTGAPTLPAVTLQVQAQGPGGSTQAALRVVIELAFEARVGNARVRYNPGSQSWEFPEVVVGFFAPGGQAPESPGFGYVLVNPAIGCSPDVLMVQQDLSSDGGISHRLRLSLKPGLKLEQFLGPDLARDLGNIKLSVVAEDDKKRPHRAGVTLQITPQLRLQAYSYVDDPGSPAGHQHAGATLAVNELAVDGQDALKIVSFLVRADGPQTFAARTSYGEISRATLVGRSKAEFELAVAAQPPAHTSTYSIGSRRPRLLSYARLNERLSLQLDGQLNKQAPANYELLVPILDFEVRALFLYVKLWVVPGARPGTSEAAAFVGLPPHLGRPLQGIDLQLSIESQGEASLAIEDTGICASDAQGLSRWTLAYGGLSWDNLSSAVWNVKCGAWSSDGEMEATEVVIRPHQNVLTLLKAIYDERGSAVLDLNNPFYSLEGSSEFYRCLGEKAFPDFLSGPVNNLVWALACTAAAGSPMNGDEVLLERHICGNLSARVYTFMRMRRHGKDTVPEERALMNGVEIDQYRMYFLGPITHHFTGLYPAGSSAESDPRFVDPWWRQDWSLAEYCRPEGLLTKDSERLRGVSSICLLALLVAAVGKVLLVLLPSLGPLTIRQMINVSIESGSRLSIGDWFVALDEMQKNVVDGRYAGFISKWPEEALQQRLQTHPRIEGVEPFRAW